MKRLLARVKSDLRHLRNMEAYAAATVAAVIAVLSIVGDLVPENYKWASLLAAMAIVVYRSTSPGTRSGSFADLAGDRTKFDANPLSSRWTNAREIWIFAPSAINLLSARTCDLLRTSVLNHADAVVRIVVLDPTDSSIVNLTGRQLDDSLDYPVQNFRQNLEASVSQLKNISRWNVAGSFEYRFAPYNPGFSLVITNPSSADGSVLVEFHGYHNETTNGRMHLELTSDVNEAWYRYWRSQFDHIWNSARPAQT